MLVSPDTYPGGGIACVPGGARIRVLNGSATPTGFAVSQILAGPGDASVNFASIVRIGGPDGLGGDHLLVASKGRPDASKYTMIPRSVSIYTGARGSLAVSKQISGRVISYGDGFGSALLGSF